MIPEILFISDLHLEPEREDILHLFLQFLEHRAVKARQLYILGDLFEAWIGDDDEDGINGLVLGALRTLTQAGTEVFIQHGNRDFLMGEQFERLSGCKLIADPYVVDLWGTRTILLHGDTLCTDDLDYMKFRDMVRNPQWQAQFLDKSLLERRQIAQHLRTQSKQATGQKAEYIMDVNTVTVERVFRNSKATLMIHGHTHRPKEHFHIIDGKTTRRLVLGDWYDSGYVLEFGPQGDQVQHLAV